jgi:hypothetical protein
MTQNELQNALIWPFGGIASRLEARRRRAAEKEAALEFSKNVTLARMELYSARENFNRVTEKKLIDYYAYNIKAAQTRLDYYLEIARRDRSACGETLLEIGGRGPAA